MPSQASQSSPASTARGVRVLLALGGGLAAGILISLSEAPALLVLVRWVEPIGTLWVNAIRMTVIPLVASLLIAGVNSTAEARTIGRIGGRGLLIFVLMLCSVAIATALVAPPVVDRLPIDPAGSARLRASASVPDSGGAAGAPALTFDAWLVSLIPPNPIKAASDSAILPLVVFSLLFALAIARTRPEVRQMLLRFFEGLAEALFVLVGWVLAVAPIGVFALTMSFGSRLGLGAAGAIVSYLVLLPALLLGFMLLLYPIAVTAGGVPLRRFASACATAQAVAFSTRSSLASLPALIDGAERTLKLPPAITGFLLPFAVSVFRINIPVAWTVGILFLARLYGVDLAPGQLATIVVASVLMSFSAPGIPSGSLFFMTPLLVSVGLPPEGAGILIAVDIIPDIFKTTFNVTADLTAAVILARWADPKR